MIRSNASVRDWYHRKAGIHLRGRWVKSPAHRWDYKVTRRTLLDELCPSPKDRILEIGCGPGTWTAEVAANCGKLVAVDVADGMIEQARRYTEGLDIEYVCADFLDCELSGRFDKIFSVRSIEYIHDKEALTKRIAGLLAPGGKVVIITKNRLSVWRGRYRALDFIERLLKRWRDGSGDDRPEDVAPEKDMVSPAQVAAGFAAHGLTRVKVKPVVVRLPIFRGGFREYPVVPQRLAPFLLPFFTLLFNICAKSPNWVRNLTVFLAESYCITLQGNQRPPEQLRRS